VKTFAKTILVLFLTLGVLVGQAGIASSACFPVKIENRKTCPCKNGEPSCCMEKSKQAPARQTPAIPQLETRLIQPATISSFELFSSQPVGSVVRVSACDRARLLCSYPVPLFLRHRAILI